MQVGDLIAQVTLPRDDLFLGTSINFFAQQLRGRIFVQVAQKVLVNTLVPALTKIPGIDPQTILDMGATNIQSSVAPEHLDALQVAYSNALKKSTMIETVLAAITVVSGLGMKWKSVKKDKKGPGAGPEPGGKIAVDNKT